MRSDFAVLLGASVGQPALEVYSITKDTPCRGTNGGGNNEIYNDNERYVREFYSMIVHPSGLKFVIGKDSCILQKSKALLYPKIISGRWKKNAQ